MDEDASNDRLWTVDDLSEFLGIAVNTIHGWRSKNYGPPARKIGKHLRYDPAQVREWIRKSE